MIVYDATDYRPANKLGLEMHEGYNGMPRMRGGGAGKGHPLAENSSTREDDKVFPFKLGSVHDAPPDLAVDLRRVEQWGFNLAESGVAAGYINVENLGGVPVFDHLPYNTAVNKQIILAAKRGVARSTSGTKTMIGEYAFPSFTDWRAREDAPTRGEDSPGFIHDCGIAALYTYENTPDHHANGSVPTGPGGVVDAIVTSAYPGPRGFRFWRGGVRYDLAIADRVMDPLKLRPRIVMFRARHADGTPLTPYECESCFTEIAEHESAPDLALWESGWDQMAGHDSFHEIQPALDLAQRIAEQTPNTHRGAA